MIAVALAADSRRPRASAAQNLDHAKAAGIAKLKKQAKQETKKAVKKSLPGARTPGLSKPLASKVKVGNLCGAQQRRPADGRRAGGRSAAS